MLLMGAFSPLSANVAIRFVHGADRRPPVAFLRRAKQKNTFAGLAHPSQQRT